MQRVAQLFTVVVLTAGTEAVKLNGIFDDISGSLGDVAGGVTAAGSGDFAGMAGAGMGAIGSVVPGEAGEAVKNASQ